MRADHLATVIAAPVCAAGCSLFSGGSLDSGEAIVAAAVAVVASAYAYTLYRSVESPMRLQARAVLVLARALVAVVPQSVRVGRTLLAAIRTRPEQTEGEVAAQPFHLGGDDPADAGRRAVVVLAQSLAPNGFVLAVAPEGALLVHQLQPQPPSSDPEWAA